MGVVRDAQQNYGYEFMLMHEDWMIYPLVNIQIAMENGHL